MKIIHYTEEIKVKKKIQKTKCHHRIVAIQTRLPHTLKKFVKSEISLVLIINTHLKSKIMYRVSMVE